MPLIPCIPFMLSCRWGILPGYGAGACAIPLAAAALITSAMRPAAAGTIECFRVFMVPLTVGRVGRAGDLGVAAGGSEPNVQYNRNNVVSARAFSQEPPEIERGIPYMV